MLRSGAELTLKHIAQIQAQMHRVMDELTVGGIMAGWGYEHLLVSELDDMIHTWEAWQDNMLSILDEPVGAFD